MPFDDFDLPELAEAPLDMPSALPGMPNPQAPQSEKKGGGFGEIAKLLPMIAAAASKGGRAGIAGFLQGVQRARMAKMQQERLGQQDARLGQQDARQAALDQRAISQQDWQRQYQRQQLDAAALQRKQQVLQQFGTAINGVDDPEAVRALLELYGPQADAVGVGRPVLERYAMQTATPSKLQTKAATSRIGKLRTEHGTKWMEEGAKFMHDLPGGERVSFEELLRRSGLTPDPAAAQAAPASSILPDVPLDRQHAMAVASGNEALAKQIEQALTRQDATRRDPPRPTAGSDPEITDLRKELLRLQVERAGEEKEPNQAQFTAAGYAGRMEQAEPILASVAPSITGMNLAAYELQTNSWFAKPTFQSKEVQSYMQASRNFINAVLRRESGAVISPTEFDEAKKQYLPLPGDDPGALAQKAQNRAYVFSTMKRSSGRAYEPPMAPPSATVPPLSKDAEVGKVYLHNGKKVKVTQKTRTGFLFDEVGE